VRSESKANPLTAQRVLRSAHAKGSLIAMSIVAFIILAGVTSNPPAPVTSGKIAIDPSTVIRFETGMLGFFSITGAFDEVAGTIDLMGPEDGDETIDVVIRTNSVRTDGDWRETICESDFFDCTGHPEMRFQSTSIERKGKDKALVHGTLTMRGVSKPFTLDASFETITDASGVTIAYKNFRGSGHLQRSDFGMTSLYPVVGDEVKIEIESGATVSPQ
jgi:polyisoprenoid-binding protein YceI